MFDKNLVWFIHIIFQLPIEKNAATGQLVGRIFTEVMPDIVLGKWVPTWESKIAVNAGNQGKIELNIVAEWMNWVNRIVF
ncbi:MAG: hypothetical protein GX640_08250 [Fibrobacter sp.]|nr:hypothetical protein [Fibrobacter sp.]